MFMRYCENRKRAIHSETPVSCSRIPERTHSYFQHRFTSLLRAIIQTDKNRFLEISQSDQKNVTAALVEFLLCKPKVTGSICKAHILPVSKKQDRRCDLSQLRFYCQIYYSERNIIH